MTTFARNPFIGLPVGLPVRLRSTIGIRHDGKMICALHRSKTVTPGRRFLLAVTHRGLRPQKTWSVTKPNSLPSSVLSVTRTVPVADSIKEACDSRIESPGRQVRATSTPNTRLSATALSTSMNLVFENPLELVAIAGRQLHDQRHCSRWQNDMV
jgi:hypothetical protein